MSVTWARVRAVVAVAVGATAVAGGLLQIASATAAPLPDLAAVEQVIGTQQAWQAGATGQGIDVALLDTGVTPVQGLNADNKLIFGPDLSFDSQNSSTAYVDNFGHGTAMAGIIAGNDGTAGGFQGVAPGSRIVSVKVGAHDGSVDVSQIIAGIDWVVQHAHDPGVNIRVLSLSLGTSSTQAYTSDPLTHAAENAWKHGIAVVVAAGNDGTATNVVADPATDPYLIAVGAEDPVGTVGSADDVVPSYSSRGTGNRHADVVAPGSNIMSLLSPGSYLAQQYPNAIFNNRYFRGSGTSQAAAVASGVVADLLSAHPGWTPDQVKAALMQTATRISTNNPNFVGAGLVNLPSALAATPGPSVQTWAPAMGNGSLEQARGNTHIAYNGTALTGEVDVFGAAWTSAAMASAADNLAAWRDGTYNGNTWAGTGWSSVTWSSVTWSSVTWSSVTWSSVTWSSVTWSSVTWSSVTWSSVTWSSVTWSSVTWSSVTWSSVTWSSVTWSAASWA
jgi:serine protease AprX